MLSSTLLWRQLYIRKMPPLLAIYKPFRTSPSLIHEIQSKKFHEVQRCHELQGKRGHEVQRKKFYEVQGMRTEVPGKRFYGVEGNRFQDKKINEVPVEGKRTEIHEVQNGHENSENPHEVDRKKISEVPGGHKINEGSEVQNFQVVYKFKYIRVARVVCRLKLYQTAITTLAVPWAGYLASLGTISLSDLATTGLVNVFAFGMLYVMGEIFRRIVGLIYYNPETDLVKISHLTFWGRRRDVFIPREDIVPISDSDLPQDIYVNVYRYSQPKFSLFLSLRFGNILDHEKLSDIFGDLS